MNPTGKRLSASLTSHAMHDTRGQGGVEYAGSIQSSSGSLYSSTPERNGKKINKANEQTKMHVDKQYHDVEKILKVAKGIASDLAFKLHPSEKIESGSTLQYDDREYDSGHVIHIDKLGLQTRASTNRTSTTHTDYDSKAEYGMKRNAGGGGGLADYKLMISQRDSELHSLRQNFEIQYQESIILKQKLQQAVHAYEQLIGSMRPNRDKDLEVNQLRSALEKSDHAVRETRQENVVLREKITLLERDGSIISQRILQSERSDHLDQLSAKDREIAVTLQRLSAVQRSLMLCSETNKTLEADKNSLQAQVDNLQEELSKCVYDGDFMREEISKLHRELHDEQSRCGPRQSRPSFIASHVPCLFLFLATSL